MKDINELLSRLNYSSDVINFNSGSLGFIPPFVIEDIHTYLLERNRKGASYGEYWSAVDRARELVGEKIGAGPDEICFLQSTSMGINLVANALPLHTGDEVIITDMEFGSNVFPWLNLAPRGVKTVFVHNREGQITAEDIFAAVTERTKVIAVSWVMSGNGVVLDLERIGTFCKAHDVFFVVDGIQGLGVLPVNVKAAGCDFFVSGFFKWMMGPDGIAFVYIDSKVLPKLSYPWLGWAGMKDKFNASSFKVEPVGNARCYETGNMNYSAIHALVPLLEATEGYDEAIYERVCSLVRRLRAGLETIPEIRVTTPEGPLSGITHFTSTDDERLIPELQKRGFNFTVRSGIRISLHIYNTEEEVDQLIETIKDIFQGGTI